VNELILHPASLPSADRVRAPAVYVEGRRRRDLLAESVEGLPAPDFGRARLTMTMAGAPRPARSLADADELPAIGTHVLISAEPGGREPIFQGVISAHTAGVGPEREELGVRAVDALAGALAGPVSGRWAVDGDEPAFLPEQRCAFNAGDGGGPSAASYRLPGGAARVFDDAGASWSVADILAYLLAAHVPADLTRAGLEHLAGPAADLFPGALDLTGLSVAESLARTAARAGLAFRGRLSGDGVGLHPTLVLYRPGVAGRPRRVALQPRGATLHADRTNLWRGGFTLRARPGRRTVVALGEAKVHEMTLPLQPGWDAALETPYHCDFVRGRPGFSADLANVFRKWVLNEAGQYSGPPWELPAFDLAEAAGEDFLVARRRPLGPVLPRGGGRRSPGVVVEVSYDDGVTWRRYGGPVRLAGDECSLWLADDALPGDYFQAALAGTARVRVTGTITADRRLRAEVTGDPSAGVEVIERTATWRQVQASSALDAADADERDEGDRLARLAEQHARRPGRDFEAELTLATVEPAWAAGDLVERIEGRGLDLPAAAGLAGGAHVVAVDHRLDEEWTTRLIVRA
jgi:hypothetical protein